MKRANGGKVSEHQQRWLDQLELLGWKVMVGFGADDAIDQLEALGFGKAKA